MFMYIHDCLDGQTKRDYSTMVCCLPGESCVQLYPGPWPSCEGGHRDSSNTVPAQPEVSTEHENRIV